MGARYGILGGGQLGRMLAEAAKRRCLDYLAFCHQDEPAAKANLSTTDDFELFLNSRDSFIIESEFFKFDRLGNKRDKLIPPFDCLEALSNKLNQKKLLKELKIPTARFIEFQADDFDEEMWRSFWVSMTDGFVIKAAFGGYDGKGNLVVRSPSDYQRSTDFIRQHSSPLFYVEEFISFDAELALLAAVSSSGEFLNYPLMLTKQHQGVCQEVMGPAICLGIESELQQQAQAYAQALAKETNLMGCFAIEFFESSGALLVNEIAPRVHNSAHCTQLSHNLSQFDLHWAAIEGESVSLEAQANFFGMRNILGRKNENNFEPELPYDTPEYLQFCWYEKNNLRIGRKMGHVNIVANSKQELYDRLLEAKHLSERIVG